MMDFTEGTDPIPELTLYIDPMLDEPVAIGPDEPPPKNATHVYKLKRWAIKASSLTSRYSNPFFVMTEDKAEMVKGPPEASTRDQERLAALNRMANHEASTEAERENARKRIAKIESKIREKSEEDNAFLDIDRRVLFAENMDILCGGLCGFWTRKKQSVFSGESLRIFDKHFGEKHEHYFFIYAESQEEVDGWITEAMQKADVYDRVPKRLEGDASGRPRVIHEAPR